MVSRPSVRPLTIGGSPAAVRDRKLLERRPDASAARQLDHQVVYESLGNILQEIGRSDAGFVDGQWDARLATQQTHQMDAVRGQRLFQQIDADLLEGVRHTSRIMELEALIGIGPDKATRWNPFPYRFGHDDVRRGGNRSFEVKVLEAGCNAFLHFLEDRRAIVAGERVTQCHDVAVIATAQKRP